MKSFININHRFTMPNLDLVCPRVTSFHSYPKHSGLMSHKITPGGWALEYHAKAAGRIFLKSRTHKLERQKHTVHLYAPGSLYWEDTHDADFPIQETYCYFTGADIFGLSSLVSQDYKFARFLDPDNVMGPLFMAASSHCAALGEESFWIIQSLFLKIIHHLLRSKPITGFDYRVAESAPSREICSFSNQVEELLKRNTHRSLSLGEIASYMKTSESLMCHKFKSETGSSPIARHSELRIEFAKSLIIKGEKFKSIAAMTGYSDEYHFSKAFKATTGLPPRAYKQRQG